MTQTSNSYLQLRTEFIYFLLIRGFYPKGGGEVRVTVDPLPKINPILLTNRGKLEDLTIECYATKEIPNHVSGCPHNIMYRLLYCV